MDNIIFYQLLASSGRPRLPNAATSSITLEASLAPLSVRQTTLRPIKVTQTSIAEMILSKRKERAEIYYHNYYV